MHLNPAVRSFTLQLANKSDSYAGLFNYSFFSHFRPEFCQRSEVRIH
jgi:hypothetical protein